jgi:FG-GAP-like repeat
LAATDKQRKKLYSTTKTIINSIDPCVILHDGSWVPQLNGDVMRANLFLVSMAVGALVIDAGCSDPNTLLMPAPGSPMNVTGSALAAGDVNRDGHADLLVVADKRLLVFFGGRNHTWTDQPDVFTDLPTKASEMALADLDEDGAPDIVLADHGSYDVAVWLGGGDGHFTAAAGSPFVAREGKQPHTHGLAVADVNGDGHLDIVTANNDDGDVSLLIGNGKGNFVRSPDSPFICGERPYPIAASDLNGDGCFDVLVPNADLDGAVRSLSLLLGSSRGELTPAQDSPLVCDETVWYAASGDLNGDQRPDIVATHSEGGSGATIFLNTAEDKFVAAPGSPLEFGHGVWGVEIVDMDRDGFSDLVVAADTSIRVMIGDGTGRFRPAPGSPFRTGKGAWRLAVADFNGDGRPDVATRCVEANRVEILHGR